MSQRIAMGIVARQGIKYTLVGYAGFVLGALSTYFLFPLDYQFYGTLSYTMSVAEIFVPFVVFGVSYANVKYFYKTQKEGKHQNVFALSLGFIVLNFLLFAGIFGLVHYCFPSLMNTERWGLRYFILPLVLILSLCHLCNRYASNYKRIAIPNIFENIFPKMANVLAFVFFLLGAGYYFSLSVFVGVLSLALLGYFVYLNRLEKFSWNFSTHYLSKDGFYKSFLSYSFFGFLGNVGNFIAIKIDKIMIGDFISMQEVGIYSTILGMISLISMPQLGLFSISAPIINRCLEEGDMEELDRFHKKTSLNLFFLGTLLFTGLLSGFPYLTLFIKNGLYLLESEPVVWILGSAILVDLATGFNGNIISLSKYYRFNILIMLLLAVMSIVLNYLFLHYTELGIVGIALATAISLFVYNAIKLVFNYRKFKVNPITMEMLLLAIISTLSVTFAVSLPEFRYPILNLIYKPLLAVGCVLASNHFLSIVPLKEYLQKGFLKNLFGKKL